MLILTAERNGGFRMLRKLLFCLALLVVAGPATADDAMLCSTETGDAAVAACTRAINSGAGRPSINYNSRGEAYRSKGDMDRAIADYTEALRLNPKYALAYSNRGLAYRDKGDTDRAIANLTEAIRLDPKSAIAYNNRGSAYWRKGENDRAIADYTEALRLDPKNAIAYVNRGLIYENLLQISLERGLTSTLRLDCHKRAQNGCRKRRESGLPPYLRHHQQRRCSRNPVW